MARSSENFTKIPNEILEALAKIRLGSYETRLLLFIIRKTYGWHKKTDWIALSQLSEGTGISKPNVCRTIRSLVARNIIVRGRNKHVGLQTIYEKWLSKETISLSNEITLLSNQTPTKET